MKFLKYKKGEGVLGLNLWQLIELVIAVLLIGFIFWFGYGVYNAIFGPGDVDKATMENFNVLTNKIELMIKDSNFIVTDTAPIYISPEYTIVGYDAVWVMTDNHTYRDEEGVSIVKPLKSKEYSEGCIQGEACLCLFKASLNKLPTYSEKLDDAKNSEYRLDQQTAHKHLIKCYTPSVNATKISFIGYNLKDQNNKDEGRMRGIGKTVYYEGDVWKISSVSEYATFNVIYGKEASGVQNFYLEKYQNSNDKTLFSKDADKYAGKINFIIAYNYGELTLRAQELNNRLCDHSSNGNCIGKLFDTILVNADLSATDKCVADPYPICTNVASSTKCIIDCKKLDELNLKDCPLGEIINGGCYCPNLNREINPDEEPSRLRPEGQQGICYVYDGGKSQKYIFNVCEKIKDCSDYCDILKIETTDQCDTMEENLCYLNICNLEKKCMVNVLDTCTSK